MQSSVTSGIISAVNREIDDEDGKTYTAIQTDAAINSGNSGGALVNAKGEVIGINTLKLSGTGIEGMGFAIPINSTTKIISQLTEFGEVKRPYIGISGYSVNDYVSEVVRQQYELPNGIYVYSVENDSPASAAEIQKGDIVTKINGIEVSSISELNKEKNKHDIGEEVTLTIVRKQKEQEVKVKLAETPAATENKKDDNKKEDTEKVPNNQQNQQQNFDDEDLFNYFFR